MLKLTGDTGKIFTKIREHFLSKSKYRKEVKEEIENFKPSNSINEIIKRQEKVKELIEVAKRVDFRKVEKLKMVNPKKKFFSDRVYIAKNDDEYIEASNLGVCEVVRFEESTDYPILLNDFVSEISLESFVPEIFVSALLDDLETIRNLAELEKDVSGENKYLEILRDLESIREEYNRLVDLDRIEKDIFEMEARINAEIERRLSEIKLTITGDELLKLMEGKEISGIIEKHIISVLEEFEKELNSVGIKEPVFTRTFPVRIDQESLFREIKRVKSRISLEFYLKCLKIAKKIDISEINMRVSHYRKLELYKILGDDSFVFPEFGDGTEFLDGWNLFIEKPDPVSYCIGKAEIHGRNENIAILTGANSGGKTSLLELVCQIVILAHMGFPVNARNARISIYNEIFYFRKKQTSYGSGAFEKAISGIAKTIAGKGKKLILIDEFESVTEPGAGAKILASLLKIADKKGHHAIVVSHLGDEFREFDFLRIDGIEAKGLDENLNLIVDRQPVFEKVGKSTPELIIERLMEKNKGEIRDIFREVLSVFRKK